MDVEAEERMRGGGGDPNRILSAGWRHEIKARLWESADVKRMTAETCSEAILRAAEVIADSLAAGGKLFTCGNGGSAADAQHIAAELVGRLRPESALRPALPAIALTTDTSILTALGNDYGFEAIFRRQVEALGCPGDVLLAISTSGRSENVLGAVAVAAARGLATIGLTGGSGGQLAERVGISIVVPSSDSQRVQEAHITIGHILCELVERLVSSAVLEEAVGS